MSQSHIFKLTSRITYIYTNEWERQKTLKHTISVLPQNFIVKFLLYKLSSLTTLPMLSENGYWIFSVWHPFVDDHFSGKNFLSLYNSILYCPFNYYSQTHQQSRQKPIQARSKSRINRRTINLNSRRKPQVWMVQLNTEHYLDGNIWIFSPSKIVEILQTSIWLEIGHSENGRAYK